MLHPDCSLPYQSAAQGCRSRLLLKAAADRGRLPSSRKQVARVEHEMSFGGVCMSITTYLNDFDTDLETKRVLGAALERTRVSLGLADKFADGIIARRIVELARAGERHPDVLCEGVLKTLRGHLFGD
jgi:hypothetical protein